MEKIGNLGDWLISRENCIEYVQESKSDIEFFNLGYKKENKHKKYGEEGYIDTKRGLGINFIDDKFLELSYISPMGRYEIFQLTPKELSAIYHKAQEKGWNL